MFNHISGVSKSISVDNTKGITGQPVSRSEGGPSTGQPQATGQQQATGQYSMKSRELC